MSKYKPLSKEELRSLEKEFIDFLVLNGITGDDWVKMKKTDITAAEEMTALFSDVVWEGILRKNQFMIHRSASSIKCFQCLESQIVLVGIDSDTLDLTTKFSAVKDGSRLDEVKVYTTSKAYSNVREAEMFDMIGWGCELDDGTLFKTLCLLL